MRMNGQHCLKMQQLSHHHLKPLYIEASINGRPINWVFVDGGVVLNFMPIVTLKKLGKNKTDLITTNMGMTNFTSKVMVVIRVLVVDITVGPNTLSSTFFVVEAKPTYFVLLKRD